MIAVDSGRLNSELKKKKQALLEEFDVLDVFSEENNLDDGERARLQEVKCELEHIWQMEETKAKQRSRDRFIKEGDRNTAYFQTLANQINRKKNINALLGPEGECVENKGMLEIVTNFYKKLFGYEQKPDIHLEDSFWEPDEMISIAENEMLDAPLTEEEIKSAIFGSYADGAPGPDGFPFLFYQRFWDLIKLDFMALVDAFNGNELDIARLNYVILTLIPKEENATEMKKFRPIALINCSFKIFSKALNNRLIRIIDRLISPNQTAFIKADIFWRV